MEMQYADYCRASSYLFGCVSLRKKQYCILNKQYTKEEYETTIPKIIEHMDAMPYVDKNGRTYRYGEFFPIELSPFAYNESVVQEYYRYTKEEAENEGFAWKEIEEKHYEVTKRLAALPQESQTITDAILNDVIGCEHEGICNHQCSTAFKVVSEELQFYRRLSLPLPTTCPNCRHYERVGVRPPALLWNRHCLCQGKVSEGGSWKNTINHFHGAGHCPNEFETSYAPDRPEIVYCEACYNAEVV